MSGTGRTVRWTHTVLKMTLDYAVNAGHLGKNPASRTKFPRMRSATHTYLTVAEVAALAEACGSQGDVVLILAYTGLRFGELTGLNVEDVDLRGRRLRVRRSFTQVGGRLVEGNPKSEAGRRSVPIPERLVPALKERIDGRPPGAPAIASPKGCRLGDRSNRPRESPSTRPSSHLCVSVTASGRRPSIAPKGHGTRIDHRDCPHVRRPL